MSQHQLLNINAILTYSDILNFKTLSGYINANIKIFECQHPFIIIIYITLHDNQSCRLDINQNDLAIELQYWLKGKIIPCPCLICNNKLNEIIIKFVKHGISPTQQQLYNWILSRTEYNVDTNEIKFGGFNDYYQNKNNHDDLNIYENITTSLTSGISNDTIPQHQPLFYPIILNDINRESDNIDKHNQHTFIKSSPNKLTNTIKTNNFRYNNKTDEDIYVNTHLQKTKNDILVALDYREKLIKSAEYRNHEIIKRTNELKGNLQSSKQSRDQIKNEFEELFQLRSLHDEIDRDIKLNQVQSRKVTTQLIKSSPLRQRSPFKSSDMGPMPLSLMYTQVKQLNDEMIDRVISKYYWDKCGRKHIRETYINDESSQYSHLKAAFCAIHTARQNAIVYKLDLIKSFTSVASRHNSFTINDVQKGFESLGVALHDQVLEALFNYFKVTDDGFITASELFWLFINKKKIAREYKQNILNLNLVTKEIEYIYNIYDRNGKRKGLLPFNEFLSLLKQFNIHMNSVDYQLVCYYFVNKQTKLKLYEFREFLESQMKLLDLSGDAFEAEIYKNSPNKFISLREQENKAEHSQEQFRHLPNRSKKLSNDDSTHWIDHKINNYVVENPVTYHHDYKNNSANIGESIEIVNQSTENSSQKQGKTILDVKKLNHDHPVLYPSTDTYNKPTANKKNHHSIMSVSQILQLQSQIESKLGKEYFAVGK